MSEEKRRVQLDDIAAALGISKTTVSRALSGKGRIGAETRERVIACAKEMNYVAPAPALVTAAETNGVTHNIGVVIPMDSKGTEAPFFQTCMAGITKCCAVRGYDTLMIGAEENDISHLKRVISQRKVDGIIITRTLADGSMEKMLREAEIPFVAIGRSADESAVTVDSAHTEGCCELTSYLMMNNPPERIGLLLGKMDQTVNKSRLAGFEQAFTNAGLTPNADLTVTGLGSEILIQRAVSELLRRGCGCIICGDDVLCMQLVTVLSSMGTAIPRDVKVASFYGNDYLDMYSPPITSLKFGAADLGMTAADQIMNMLDRGSAGHPTILGFEMLIRKSTM